MKQRLNDANYLSSLVLLLLVVSAVTNEGLLGLET